MAARIVSAQVSDLHIRLLSRSGTRRLAVSSVRMAVISPIFRWITTRGAHQNGEGPARARQQRCSDRGDVRTSTLRAMGAGTVRRLSSNEWSDDRYVSPRADRAVV